MFIGLSMLTFTLARVIPGQSVRLALDPRATGEAARQFRRQMGLDQPIWFQHINYMTDPLHDDLGQSLIPSRDVATDLIQYLLVTLELTTVAMLVVITVGVSLGVISGQYKDAALDNLSRSFSFFNVSPPPSWAGILLRLAAAFGLGWLPVTGRIGDVSPVSITVIGLLLVDSVPVWNVDMLISAAQHLALPALMFSPASMADITWTMRSSFIKEYDRDYVKDLQTHGIPDKLVAYKYVLRKSFAPILTIIDPDYDFLLGSTFVVEIAFSWSGMASCGMEAILQKNMSVMVGVAPVIGGSSPLVNFLVDILCGFFDPRVWHEDE